MSHSHTVDRWLMALTKKDTSYITVLGIGIAVLPISSRLLQDGYHVCFKHNSRQKRSGANQTTWISTKQMCPNNSLPDCISHAISIFNSNTIPQPFLSVLRPYARLFLIPILIPFPRPFLRPFPRPFPSPILIISIAAHCFKKAGYGCGFVKQSASISAVGA